MNAGTASEVKASEAMVKKDHAGNLEGLQQRSSALIRVLQAPQSTGNTPSSTSTRRGRTWWRERTATALRYFPPACHSPPQSTPPPPCPCQASIEALDKRMRECGWAQKFCAAMAALQVSCLPPLLCRGRVLNTHVATGGQRGARQQRRRLCLPRRTAAAALGAQRGEFYHAGYTLLPPPAACTLLTRACRAVCGLGL